MNLTISNLDEDVERKLRVRAVSNRRSIEAEAQAILKDALREDQEERGLATAIHELVAPYGGIELDIPPRDEMVPNTSIFDE